MGEGRGGGGPSEVLQAVPPRPCGAVSAFYHVPVLLSLFFSVDTYLQGHEFIAAAKCPHQHDIDMYIGVDIYPHFDKICRYQKTVVKLLFCPSESKMEKYVEVVKVKGRKVGR